jgi:hypothetical protein
MCLCMLRRSLLTTALLAPVLGACEFGESRSQPSPAAVSAIEKQRWLDVHCHVFNARDVPIYQFVHRTRMNDAVGFVFAPVLALLAGTLQFAAPSAEDEAARIEAGTPPLFRASPPPGTLAAAQIGHDGTVALMKLRALAVSPGGISRASPAVPSSTQTAPYVPSSDEILVLFDAAFKETGIRSAPPTELRAAEPNVKPPVPTDDEVARFAVLIGPRNQTGVAPAGFFDILRRYFTWGLMFAEDRNALITRLAALYPGQELMLTPAMVDYDLWLDAPDSDLPGQVKVMSAIAASRSAAGTPVHPFLAFDPWRCLRDRQRGNDPLAEIKRALSEGRGIGIKLYPPMGFAAAGNTDRSADDFPLELRKLAANPGRSLDGVLDELFDYCADNDVPVMAHCGQSNGSAKQYETLADPCFGSRRWTAHDETAPPQSRTFRWDLGDGCHRHSAA